MGGSLPAPQNRAPQNRDVLRTPTVQGHSLPAGGYCRRARARVSHFWLSSEDVPVLGFILAALAALALAAVIAPAPARAADLFLTGEREVYLAVDKLNAMGRLPGLLANTRPYSVAAVRAALTDNATQGGGFDGELARWVSYATKPTFLLRGTAGFEADEKRETRDNEGDIPTPKGVSARLSILAREEANPFVSAHASAAAFFGEAGDDGTRIGETALETGIPSASLQFGKIATWYGPGRRGTLIFTNNARSYPGIRFHNPVPIPITGFFSFLGSVQYDLFFARLDEDRPVPDSMLSGMRLAARPSRYLEIGFSRAIHYGGEGHSNGLSAWWDAFKGTSDNQEGYSGNQIAGFDVTLTLPFPSQPVQAYLEMAGEDEADIIGTPIPGPTKWAYLAGIFLPAILSNPSYDLRFEYADNHRDGDGGSWYTHPYYPHDYKGRILGHPMGTDARDLWLQGHHFFLPSTYLELTLSRTERYSLGPEKETTDRAAAGLVGWLTARVRAEAEIAQQRVENPGGLPGPNANDASFRVAVSYQIGSGR